MKEQELICSLCKILQKLIDEKDKRNTVKDNNCVEGERLTMAVSIDFEKHPMKNVKKDIKEKYFNIVKFLVLSQSSEDYVCYILRRYGEFFLNDKNIQIDKEHIYEDIKSIVGCQTQPWRKKYKYGILLDIAIILQDEKKVYNAFNQLEEVLSKKQKSKFRNFYKNLINMVDDGIDCKWSYPLIHQCWENIRFRDKKEIKIIVSATMSAGKSTLINALIGKKLMKSSQEVCTGNVCYVMSKPFEDGHISMIDNGLWCEAGQQELEDISWKTENAIQSCFRSICTNAIKSCYIDTPGVNSSINKNHEKITKEKLLNNNYDKLIYVMNANKIGTDEEMAYLQWISMNVPKNKIVFVLNKIDDFKIKEDDIEKSILGIKQDLLKLGFDEPLICPISAYFSLLIKMKLYNESLSEDEQDEYGLYMKKFNRPAYDLSKYYGLSVEPDETEMVALSKKCGLYGLEKIIGGTE